MTTKVEILYFDGCPSYKEAEKTVRSILVEEDVEADVELVSVNTDEEVERLRFPGSPTIRVDGRDLFPSGTRERGYWRLGCRVYATPDGLKSCPTEEMLRDALARQDPRAEARGSGVLGTARSTPGRRRFIERGPAQATTEAEGRGD
jgi:hypothetical protein